ncbi:metalloregulator ArsR/SmtB family transcription factor [Gordonia sp. w5E2]|uniref:ArsR family transcriptional regulator n=1 Tax=Gordonia jacobaea TaxID=122202 RepID=A0ABR5IE59_9ACTN|nr:MULTISPECIES: metalloregulator ArsR/SmtB family transcription factor [Gordonia]KNA91996.1 ArsR family transcriptional regulator [Gordonia jacobaea]MCM3897698.1 metalloregulator ArsR/SmtB family transcription factor [Gordonia sputi]
MGTRGQCSDGLGSRGVGARDVAAREAASDLLRALASPMRIAIVLALQEDARCVHELVGSLGVSQPLVSQHLRVLKDAGVVSGERNGREIMYSLIDDHLAHIVTDALTHATEPRPTPQTRGPDAPATNTTAAATTHRSTAHSDETKR